MTNHLKGLIENIDEEIPSIAKDLVLNPEPVEVHNHYVLKIKEKAKEILSVEAAIKELADMEKV